MGKAVESCCCVVSASTNQLSLSTDSSLTHSKCKVTVTSLSFIKLSPSFICSILTKDAHVHGDLTVD